MLGHFQAQVQTQHEQSQNQVNQILAQNEMLRLDARQREEIAKQREDSIRNENLNRESLFVRMKIAADQTNAEHEKAQIEATLQMRRETAEANQKREQDLIKMKADADESTRKRAQLFMEHELKRQKMIVEAHSAVQQERLKADMNREIASLEVFERRELEFQQAQEKERERAITAQQKLREIASQELQERIQLERELARQQQKNVLLQKQNEIEKLEAQAFPAEI